MCTPATVPKIVSTSIVKSLVGELPPKLLPLIVIVSVVAYPLPGVAIATTAAPAAPIIPTPVTVTLTVSPVPLPELFVAIPSNVPVAAVVPASVPLSNALTPVTITSPDSPDTPSPSTSLRFVTVEIT